MTPDGLDPARYRDVQSRTLDDLDSVLRAEIPSRTTIAIPVTSRELRSDTPDELAYATDKQVDSGTPDDLDFAIRSGLQTPDDIDCMIRANLRSTTPDERYSSRAGGRQYVTDDVNVLKRRERSCMMPDDLDSDDDPRVSATRSGSGHECVDSEASRLQRTKSLSSLLHSSIASWELTNKSVLNAQPAGEAATGADRMYFQSRADVPPKTNLYRDVARPTENVSSRTEGYSSNRDRLGTSVSTDVVGKHLHNKSRGTTHALDDCVTDRYVARQQSGRSAALVGSTGTSTASGSIYRYTPLRKATTTNLTRSAGALSTRSKSVSHLLGDMDTHASATCFLNLDEKPRCYNPPAERLDPVSSRGQTTRSATSSPSPDLVRRTAPVATTRSDHNRGDTRSFLPVGGAARPSRQDAQLCHPTAVSLHHGGGDTGATSDREFKPRHMQVPSTPPVKLYHIDNV